MAEVRPSSRRGNRGHSYGPNPVVASGIDSMQMDSMGGHYDSESGTVTGRPQSRPGTSQSIDMRLGNTPSVSPELTRKRQSRTRPKSAKGRTRAGGAGYQTHLLSQQMSLQDDDDDTESVIEQVLRTTPVRPNSSLSKFKPLPAIPKSASMECNTHDDNMNISHFDNSTSSQFYEEPTSVNKHQSLLQPTKDLSDDGNPSAPQRDHDDPNISRNHDFPPQLNSNVNKSSHKRISRKDFRQHQKARLARVKLNIPVPCEPGKNEPRIQLAIRLPEGERLVRFFHPENTLKEVLAYADSESSESLLDCDMFINSIPEKIFMDLSKSIKESGLQDKTVIYLEDKDYE
ncbi:uncharacterized protein LOC102808818 [Saccoglossus kowalevskii]|uniref:Uncharacterized protein LOC102808818 n=1 Tax=Saccoglossus kowalevskii TaxID=10224 RepID=A0ABM0LW77_SACKO|nr:PREDICTED: uncharacterized protein LOC102808818 [Saccoglossus kowalevskii]